MITCTRITTTSTCSQHSARRPCITTPLYAHEPPAATATPAATTDTRPFWQRLYHAVHRGCSTAELAAVLRAEYPDNYHVPDRSLALSADNWRHAALDTYQMANHARLLVEHYARDTTDTGTLGWRLRRALACGCTASELAQILRAEYPDTYRVPEVVLHEAATLWAADGWHPNRIEAAARRLVKLHAVMTPQNRRR